MIEDNITSAKKILTKLAQEKSWEESVNQDSGRLHKDELLLTLCAIPTPDLDKLHDRMEWQRKEILKTMLTENPWLSEHRMGTL